jgi:phosphatidylinositol-4,5-bisphosphate 4-phosphatase
MAIGLERFNELTHSTGPRLEDRRVQVDRQTGEIALRAPTTLWGRFVDWIQGTDHTHERLQEYEGARTALYDALVKSYGAKFANDVMNACGKTDLTFKTEPRRLEVGDVRQVLETAERLLDRNVMLTWRGVDRFIAQGGLGKLPLPEGAPDPRGKPELEKAFQELVRRDPGFGREAFGEEKLQALAGRALDQCIAARKARFVEQYPELAKLDNAHVHDVDSYLNNLMHDVYSVTSPLYDPLGEDLRMLAGEAIQGVMDSVGHLAEMRFDPGKAGEQQQAITEHRAALANLSASIGEALDGEAFPPQARPLFEALAREIDNQRARLSTKLETIDEYLQADPLSDKAVAYDKLVWRQATVVALEHIDARLRERHDQLADGPERNKVVEHMKSLGNELVQARARVGEAQQDWEEASLERTTNPDKTIFSHKLKEARQEEQRHLDESLERCKVIFSPGSDKLLKQSRTKALDTVQDWKPITRQMTVTREGVTRTYVSQITPGSKLEGVVGQGYRDEGLGGVSAGNKSQPGHARNLQVSELFRTEPDGSQTLVSQTIRHGVLDPWDIEDAELRTKAQDDSAREVVQTAFDISKDFKARAIEKQQDPQPDQPPSKIVHVNFNLTTADDSILRKFSKDYRERDFTFNQFRAFQAMEGTQDMRTDPEDDDETVPVEVETITFSFGVNKVAMGEGVFALSGEDTLWGPVEEHDRQNLVKLLGDLTWGTAPGGHIGALVARLQAEATHPDTPPERAQELNALIGRIQDEVDIVRNLFNSGDYKRGIDDAYKMVRHAMRVVNLGQEALGQLKDHDLLMSVSQGCKSNKDRGGMGDVEHKAQLIIEDMGGRVLPNEKLEEQDQRIYDTVLTSSGQVEGQTYNTGLGGSKNVDELKARVGDKDAFTYSKGFAPWTAA